MAQFKHRRQAEEKPRRRKTRHASEVFDHEEKRTVYRGRGGKFSRKGRRGAKKYVSRVLYVRGPGGKVRRYGSIRERNKKPLVKITTAEESKIQQGIFIKGLLEERGVLDRLTEEGGRGVEITVKGRAGGKDQRLKTRFILDENRLDDAPYLASVISGRVQAFLKSHGLRLSHHSISKAKKARQLKRVTFSVSIFY